MAHAAQYVCSHRAATRPRRVHALLLAALCASGIAKADLYQWTDAQGSTVISDTLPVDPGRVSGVKLLARTPKAGARATTAQAATSAKEQELEARLEQLERELQEQRAASAPPAPPAGQSGYPPASAPAPAPDASSYVSYATEYYPSYYPSYYPPAPPVSSFIVVWWPPTVHRREAVHRPAYTPPAAPHYRPPQLAGRSPQFTGPTPRFTGPTPQFTGPGPQFAPRQEPEHFKRGGAFTPRPPQHAGRLRP